MCEAVVNVGLEHGRSEVLGYPIEHHLGTGESQTGAAIGPPDLKHALDLGRHVTAATLPPQCTGDIRGEQTIVGGPGVDLSVGWEDAGVLPPCDADRVQVLLSY